MDGFNTVQTRYLATCLIMRITTKEDKIDRKRMRVDAMTEKGEVSFAKEFKRSLDLLDEMVTKGDKNMRNVNLNHA